MEKQKKWHLFLILAVVVLTIYNILPTIFYYSNPLKKPIGPKQSEKVAAEIVERVNSLEDFTLSWLKAQSKNLGLKPVSITIQKEDPRLAKLVFKQPEEARFFTRILHRAGSLIPFVPAQLSPTSNLLDEESREVVVQRKIGVHLSPEQLNEYFHFIPKLMENGEISPEYRGLINDRAAQIALGFGGESETAKILQSIASDQSVDDDSLIRLARTIVDYENAFGDENAITQRYYASFTQISEKEHRDLIHRFIARFENLSQKISSQLTTLRDEQTKEQSEGRFLETSKRQQIEVLESQKNSIDSAVSIVRRNTSLFENGKTPLTKQSILESLAQSPIPSEKVQVIKIGDLNPFIDRLEVNWNKDQIDVLLHKDVDALRSKEITTEREAIQLEKLNQLLFNEIAMVARIADEKISPSLTNFNIALNNITNSSSLLALDISKVAESQIENLSTLIHADWHRSDGELSPLNYPIYDMEAFKKLSAPEKKLGLLLYAPVMEESSPEAFRNGSIYIIAKGLGSIREKYQALPDSVEKRSFNKDFQSLQELLKQNGFISYTGSSSELPSEYKEDYIFELDDFSSYLIAATREDFSIKGNKRYALLEFTDVEQRILTLNKIETAIHEDLLKWRDAYRQVQVSVEPAAKYDVPPPTKNVLLDNLKLSSVKYFRGDDRKILKWGLDLSGGKTVRIGLRDQNNQPITDETDLKQASNELYQRVNRLGVSEVGIRIEGSNIVLDFPGSQGLSASDLIQASAMYLHVVNEKFSKNNPTLAQAVNDYLEEVWNEAVITNRTDPENLNEIAWKHLGGNPENPDEFNPLSSHARLLYDHGLRIADPKTKPRSSSFDDSFSSVTTFRGSDFVDWQGQTNPLLIVFHNYVLEGANIIDVQTGYDPSKGNILNFQVRGSYINRTGEKVNPRDELYTWTSQFSEEKIIGTPKEAFSAGQGWRMAVILNGTVISAPHLNAALRDSASISGHFSQREVNQLAADLKAGSLSFTPHILSEENVSPDLGKEQRTQGIFAAALGLVLVIIVMCSYYRFSGLVASVAVLFNLLIIWGVLQNLDAAMTLPGLAGIILAVGMSVDANVLVFERIREEFEITKRLPSAIQTGYRKAFSAIVDSNLTTIIAAVILLNFDAGPVKGFALTLIIGIVSSMFTALFMTRYFFAGWVQNPKHKELKMSRFFGKTNFQFLNKAKIAFSLTALIVVVGGFLLVKEKNSIFGMDFTGGYALTLDLKEKPGTAYRLLTTEALEAAGASSSDFQIRELNKPNRLRIQFGMGMERPGNPFYQIENEDPIKNPLFTFQEYPRIVWVVNALEKKGLEINPASLPELNLHWTEMSGQLSDTMRNQALLGLGLALVCILIYITFRFEFKYAISATLGLAFDLLVTLSILAILHLFYESVQIDLQVIAALMTIVGYSLNDTIIIFDRVREDVKIFRKLSFYEVINHALNATLSRTVMTSGTTIVVLLALVIFGGQTIFNFALVMTLGVVIGTFSSLYIAAPLLYFFHKREVDREEHSSAVTKSL